MLGRPKQMLTAIYSLVVQYPQFSFSHIVFQKKEFLEFSIGQFFVYVYLLS